ncbi:hypothetical protein DPMN_160998 [Dreissena polymorpha]|uniref:Uncharacterized protein n=1 Tax=Dreissena polymorpha TaxID=45954 RepID=A0A9D4EN77_DREPO|nr:hypothetical protein DPMN_160998 [Dreissena polymorpha]
MFQVTVDLPPSGVIVDRLELPDHTNIKGVFVFYTRPGDDTLVTLNSGKVCATVVTHWFSYQPRSG